MRRRSGWALAVGLVLLSGCAGWPARPEQPRVSLAGLEILELGVLEQRYRLALRVENPNPFPLPIAGLDYRVLLNERTFATGVSRRSVVIPGFGTRVIEVEVTSNLLRIAAHLQDLARAEEPLLRYRLAGRIRLRGRALTLPFDYSGEVRLSPGGRSGLRPDSRQRARAATTLSRRSRSRSHSASAARTEPSADSSAATWRRSLKA